MRGLECRHLTESWGLLSVEEEVWTGDMGYQGSGVFDGRWAFGCLFGGCLSGGLHWICVLLAMWALGFWSGDCDVI